MSFTSINYLGKNIPLSSSLKLLLYLTVNSTKNVPQISAHKPSQVISLLSFFLCFQSCVSVLSLLLLHLRSQETGWQTRNSPCGRGGKDTFSLNRWWEWVRRRLLLLISQICASHICEPEVILEPVTFGSLSSPHFEFAAPTYHNSYSRSPPKSRPCSWEPPI